MTAKTTTGTLSGIPDGGKNRQGILYLSVTDDQDEKLRDFYADGTLATRDLHNGDTGVTVTYDDDPMLHRYRAIDIIPKEWQP